MLPSGGGGPGRVPGGRNRESWLCLAPGPSACCLPPASLTSCSSLGDRDAEYPQDSAPCTSAPGPWGCPASSLEPGSPESVSRGPSPRPSPESSREGSPQSQGCHSGSIFPERTGDAAHPSLLETDEAEPSSLERGEAEEALGPAEEVKSERAGQPDVSAAASEG